jgi:hypothetical protein
MITDSECSQLLPFLGDESVATDGCTACEISNIYSASISAYWRGQRRQSDFEHWLAGCWRSTLPAQPDRPADSVSPHGGGGRGIHWYESPQAVIGHVPGVTGGYWIPTGSIPADLMHSRPTADRDRQV